MGQGLVFLEAQIVLVQTLINTSVDAQVGMAQVLRFLQSNVGKGY